MATREEVVEEFTKRNIENIKRKEEERKEKEADKAKRNQTRVTTMRTTNRGPDDNIDDMTDEQLLKPQKKLGSYIKTFDQRTEFFSTFNPDIIEEAMITYLKSEKIEPKLYDNKYKMKFAKKTKTQEGLMQTIEMQMQILKCNDSTLCVEFTKCGSGDKQRFIEHYREFKEEILANMNDTVLA